MFFHENYEQISIFFDCRFINNTCYDSLIDVATSKIFINSSIFENNTNIIISTTFSSVFCLNNINVSYHKCEMFDVGCLVKSLENSTILIEKVNVLDLDKKVKDGNIYIENSNLFINNSTFKLLRISSQIGSCIQSLNSFISITATIFTDFTKNCIHSSFSSKLALISSNFTIETPQKLIKTIYGVLFCEDCSFFSLNGCVFSGNTVERNGAAISLISTLSYQNSLRDSFIVENCSFIDNKAEENAAGIFIYSVNISITKSFFLRNQAKRGAAIFLSNSGISPFSLPHSFPQIPLTQKSSSLTTLSSQTRLF